MTGVREITARHKQVLGGAVTREERRVFPCERTFIIRDAVGVTCGMQKEQRLDDFTRY